MAVAIPAFTAYLISLSFILSPKAHMCCFTRPMKDRSERAGVWTVLGAWGLIFGKEEEMWGREDVCFWDR